MVESLITKDLRQLASVKSATRVLQIFEYFAKVQRPIPLKEVVRELDYPQSSATVLLKCLVQTGYLSYNRGERTYFPTVKLSFIGSWLEKIIDPELEVLLRRIWADTGETVMLAVQNDLYMQYVEVIESQHEMRFHVEKGSLIPVTDTSLGWVVLSSRPNSEVESICRQINSRTSEPENRIDVRSFISGLEHIRRQQYCYVRNLPMRGGGCIAMNVPVTVGGLGVAVGTGGLCERLDENLNHIVERMRTNISDWQAEHQASSGEPSMEHRKPALQKEN
jgi:DNA-binding IclR family transcriptional regulator